MLTISIPVGWARRNTEVNNLPTSPRSKKGKHGSLCRPNKCCEIQTDQSLHNPWAGPPEATAGGLNQAKQAQLCKKNLVNQNTI